MSSTRTKLSVLSLVKRLFVCIAVYCACNSEYTGMVYIPVYCGCNSEYTVIAVYCGCNSEYISRGTLKSRLMDMTVELPWQLRIKFAKDVACGMVRGMRHLHCQLTAIVSSIFTVS